MPRVPGLFPVAETGELLIAKLTLFFNHDDDEPETENPWVKSEQARRLASRVVTFRT